MTQNRGRPPVRHLPAQCDLLGAPPGERAREQTAEASPPARSARAPRAAPARHRGRKEPENPLQTDLFSGPLPPRPRPPRTHLDTDELRLCAVPAREFAPHAAPDGWLYLVTEPDTASHFLEHGLPLRKAAPLLLTERGGVCGWLAKQADDTGGLFSTPAVVLRLRRTMVTGLLEPDPDHSAEFSAPCYLLSGSRQEQDT